MTKEADNAKNVRLFQQEGGSTFSTTNIKILSDGSLQLSDYDLGELAQQFAGHDDCESEVTVKAKHKDQLLFAMIADRDGGDSRATSDLVGQDDYERTVTLKPEHKERLLLGMLADRFGGDSCATSHFMKFLDSKGIPYDFDTWP